MKPVQARACASSHLVIAKPQATTQSGPLSFRDGPKDQTRNLEIPGSMLRITLEWQESCRRAGLSSFRDGPKDQTRNLEIPGSMLRIARNDERVVGAVGSGTSLV